MVIAIDGNIGTGKSFLCSQFHKVYTDVSYVDFYSYSYSLYISNKDYANYITNVVIGKKVSNCRYYKQLILSLDSSIYYNFLTITYGYLYKYINTLDSESSKMILVETPFISNVEISKDFFNMIIRVSCAEHIIDLRVKSNSCYFTIKDNIHNINKDLRSIKTYNNFDNTVYNTYQGFDVNYISNLVSNLNKIIYKDVISC